jgi:hypothetical protein
VIIDSVDVIIAKDPFVPALLLAALTRTESKQRSKSFVSFFTPGTKCVFSRLCVVDIINNVYAQKHTRRKWYAMKLIWRGSKDHFVGTGMLLIHFSTSALRAKFKRKGLRSGRRTEL